MAKILLKLETLVGSDKNLKAGGLGLSQQLAVLQAGPTLLVYRPSVVPDQVRRQLPGQLLIEQHAHGRLPLRGPLRATRLPARA